MSSERVFEIVLVLVHSCLRFMLDMDVPQPSLHLCYYLYFWILSVPSSHTLCVSPITSRVAHHYRSECNRQEYKPCFSLIHSLGSFFGHHYIGYCFSLLDIWKARTTNILENSSHRIHSTPNNPNQTYQVLAIQSLKHTSTLPLYLPNHFRSSSRIGALSAQAHTWKRKGSLVDAISQPCAQSM